MADNRAFYNTAYKRYLARYKDPDRAAQEAERATSAFMAEQAPRPSASGPVALAERPLNLRAQAAQQLSGRLRAGGASDMGNYPQLRQYTPPAQAPAAGYYGNRTPENYRANYDAQQQQSDLDEYVNQNKSKWDSYASSVKAKENYAEKLRGDAEWDELMAERLQRSVTEQYTNYMRGLNDKYQNEKKSYNAQDKYRVEQEDWLATNYGPKPMSQADRLLREERDQGAQGGAEYDELKRRQAAIDQLRRTSSAFEQRHGVPEREPGLEYLNTPTGDYTSMQQEIAEREMPATPQAPRRSNVLAERGRVPEPTAQTPGIMEEYQAQRASAEQDPNGRQKIEMWFRGKYPDEFDSLQSYFSRLSNDGFYSYLDQSIALKASKETEAPEAPAPVAEQEPVRQAAIEQLRQMSSSFEKRHGLPEREPVQYTNPMDYVAANQLRTDEYDSEMDQEAPQQAPAPNYFAIRAERDSSTQRTNDLYDLRTEYNMLYTPAGNPPEMTEELAARLNETLGANAWHQASPTAVNEAINEAIQDEKARKLAADNAYQSVVSTLYTDPAKKKEADDLYLFGTETMPKFMEEEFRYGLSTFDEIELLKGDPGISDATVDAWVQKRTNILQSYQDYLARLQAEMDSPNSYFRQDKAKIDYWSKIVDDELYLLAAMDYLDKPDLEEQAKQYDEQYKYDEKYADMYPVHYKEFYERELGNAAYGAVITDKEFSVFKYLKRENPEQAARFIDAIKIHLDARAMMAVEANAADMAKKYPFFAEMLAVGMSPAKILTAVTTFGAALAGNPLNPNELLYGANVFGKTVYDTRLQQIEKIESPFWKTVSKYGYLASTSAAESMYSISALKALGLGEMATTFFYSLGASGDAYRESMLNYEGEEVALAKAGITMASEFFTEIFTVKDIFAMLDAKDMTLWQRVIKAVFGGTKEAGQEAASRVMQYGLEYLTTGEDSEFEQMTRWYMVQNGISAPAAEKLALKDFYMSVMEEGLIGGISGAEMNITAGAMGKYARYSQNKQIKAIKTLLEEQEAEQAKALEKTPEQIAEDQAAAQEAAALPVAGEEGPPPPAAPGAPPAAPSAIESPRGAELKAELENLIADQQNAPPDEKPAVKAARGRKIARLQAQVDAMAGSREAPPVPGEGRRGVEAPVVQPPVVGEAGRGFVGPETVTGQESRGISAPQMPPVVAGAESRGITAPAAQPPVAGEGGTGRTAPFTPEEAAEIRSGIDKLTAELATLQGQEEAPNATEDEQTKLRRRDRMSEIQTELDRLRGVQQNAPASTPQVVAGERGAGKGPPAIQMRGATKGETATGEPATNKAPGASAGPPRPDAFLGRGDMGGTTVPAGAQSETSARALKLREDADRARAAYEMAQQAAADAQANSEADPEVAARMAANAEEARLRAEEAERAAVAAEQRAATAGATERGEAQEESENRTAIEAQRALDAARAKQQAAQEAADKAAQEEEQARLYAQEIERLANGVGADSAALMESAAATAAYKEATIRANEARQDAAEATAHADYLAAIAERNANAQRAATEGQTERGEQREQQENEDAIAEQRKGQEGAGKQAAPYGEEVTRGATPEQAQASAPVVAENATPAATRRRSAEQIFNSIASTQQLLSQTQRELTEAFASEHGDQRDAEIARLRNRADILQDDLTLLIAERDALPASERVAAQPEVRRTYKTPTAVGAVYANQAARAAATSARQRDAVVALDALAKVAQRRIIIEESINRGGVKANAYWDPGTGALHVALDSINQGSVIFAAHELTHAMRAESPAIYKQLVGYVQQAYADTGNNFDAAVKARFDQYRKAFTGTEMAERFSMDDAVEEVVAASTEDFLSDQKQIKRIVATNRGLGKRILDFLTDLGKKLKRALQGLESNSAEARVIKAWGDKSEAMRTLWWDAMTGTQPSATAEKASLEGQTYPTLEGTQEAARDATAKYSLNPATIDYAVRYTTKDAKRIQQLKVLKKSLETLGAIQKDYNSRIPKLDASGEPIIGKNGTPKLASRYGKNNIHNLNKFLEMNQGVWQKLVDVQKELNDAGMTVDFVTPVGKPNIVEGKQVAGGLIGMPIEYVGQPVGKKPSRKTYKFESFLRSIPQMALDSMNTSVKENLRQDLLTAVRDAHAQLRGVKNLIPTQAFDGAFPNMKEFKKVAGETSAAAIKNRMDYYAQSPIRDAEKTVMAINLNSACPMFIIGNHACYLDSCYLTQMAMGATGVNLFQSAMYTGEILQLSDEVIAMMNGMGGLRLNGVGDTTENNGAQLKDVIRDAGKRGLKLKIITKQENTFKFVDAVRAEGTSVKHVTIQPSMDNLWVPVELDDAWGAGVRGISALTSRLEGADLAEAGEAAYGVDTYGRATMVKDGKLYRKYGFTREQVEGFYQNYPELADQIVPRYVVMTANEIAELALNRDGGLNHGMLIQTLMHGKVPQGVIGEFEGRILNFAKEGVNFGGARHVVKKVNGQWKFWGVNLKEKDGKVHRTMARNQNPYVEVMDYVRENYNEAEQDKIWTNLKKQMCCQENDFKDACAGCGQCVAGSCALSSIEPYIPGQEQPDMAAEAKKVAPVTEAQPKMSLPSDASYLSAVESGDMDTAQRMVDEAAMAAGLVEGMYHGSKTAGFNEFKVSPNGAFGAGIYFSGSEREATRYAQGGEVRKFYLDLKNPYSYDDSSRYQRAIWMEEEFKGLSGEEIRDILMSQGYDGVVATNTPEARDHGEKMVFTPEQVKLADAVTRDDAGNVIPLSERFKPESADIRFSLSAPVEETQYLVAYHNLRKGDIEKALDAGGFAAPSIALIRPDMAHTRFGEITVVFDRKTIDPSVNADNYLFEGDAATPTVPRGFELSEELFGEDAVSPTSGAEELVSVMKQMPVSRRNKEPIPSVEEAKGKDIRIVDTETYDPDREAYRKALRYATYDIANSNNIPNGADAEDDIFFLISKYTEKPATVEGLMRHFAEDGRFELNRQDAYVLRHALNMPGSVAKKLPLNMVEAKPMRVVPINEGRAVILPNKPEYYAIRNRLLAAGVRTAMYDGETQGPERVRAVNSLAAKFSLPDLDAVNEVAEAPVYEEMVERDTQIKFSVRTDPPPEKTFIAYKLLRVNPKTPGKLYPLFVKANQETPVGVWLDAEEGERVADTKTGEAQVKSRLGGLAYRPGWHLGDIPLATQIGSGGKFIYYDESGKKRRVPNFMKPNSVWCECEVAADVDYQPEANRNGINKRGKLIHKKAEIKRLPKDGYYHYKTQADMVGEWVITGAMKINKVLSDSEVREILAAQDLHVAKVLSEAGKELMPRKGGDIALEKYGFEPGRRYSLSDTPPSEDLKEIMDADPANAKAAGELLNRVLREAQGAHISDPAVRSMASRLRDKLNSNTPLEDIFRNLRALFDYLERNKAADWQHVMSYAQSVVRQVIDGSTSVSETEGRETMTTELERGMAPREASFVVAEEVFRDAYREKVTKPLRDEMAAHLVAVRRQYKSEQYKAVAEAKRDVRAKNRDMDQRQKLLDQIDRQGNRLFKWIYNPDKTHFVPEDMRRVVSDVLRSLDMAYSDAEGNTKASKRAMAWQEAMRALGEKMVAADVVANTLNLSGDINYVLAVDPDLQADIASLVTENEGVTRYRDLENDQLEKLATIINRVRHAVDTANRLHVGKRNADLAAVAGKTMDFLRTLKEKQGEGALDSFLNFDMIDAFSYFDRLGDDARLILDALYKDGFGKLVNNTLQAKEFFDGMRERYKAAGIDTWTGKKAQVQTFQVKGGTVKLSTGQIMELYLLAQREQAKGHLYGKGITVERIDAREDGKPVKLWQKDPITLNEGDVARITSTLTAEQRAACGEIANFMTTTAATWGNEVTIELYGYNKFIEPNYYPIHSDPNFTMTQDPNSNEMLNAIINLGMTKATIKGANNPIIISDIFSTVGQHVTDMANYNAFVVPLSDSMKWLNYKRMGPAGAQESVKSNLERALGKGGQRYFVNLLKDVNGIKSPTKAAGFSGFVNKMVSRMKTAAVAGNVRVVIQQHTSYVRASSMLAPGDMAAAYSRSPRRGMQMAQKYCPIAAWKHLGYFDMHIGKQIPQLITGVTSPAEKLKDLAIRPAGAADDFTLGVLWNACEIEVGRSFQGARDSEEFYQAVADRLTDVIDRTQVVDSVFHRPQIMRDKDGLTKISTSFMAEPLKNFNMLSSAIRSGDKKAIARTGVACIASWIAVSMAAGLVDALRDDEKEKGWQGYWDSWRKKVFGIGGNFFDSNSWDNVNPVNMIPYAKEVYSMATGYSASRPDLQAAQKLIWASKTWIKLINGEYKGNAFSLAYSTATAISTVTGVPVGNIMRDLQSVWQTLDPRIVVGDGGIPAQTMYKRYAEALAAGDKDKALDYYSALIQGGKTPTAIRTGTVKAFKENKFIIAAAEAMKTGNLSAYENQLANAVRGGVPRDMAIKAVSSILSSGDEEAGPVTPGTPPKTEREMAAQLEYDTAVYTYSSGDLTGALEAGKTTDAKRIMATLKREGRSDSSIRSTITSRFADLYRANPSQRASIERLLLGLDLGKSSYDRKDFAGWLKDK